MSRIVERFAAAVQTLIGDGPVKNRLHTAYADYLEDLEQVELPIASKGEFIDLHAALHSVQPTGTNSRVSASIQKMSTAEAWRHAQTIVTVYTELLAMEHGARAATEASIDATSGEPPRFLARRGR